jgi:PAS domain S-box-containing protein
MARGSANDLASRVSVSMASTPSPQTGADTSRELCDHEEELRRAEGELRDFVENANVGLHRVGPDGTILWANRAELSLLGYAEDEYVGHSIATFHVDHNVIADILARLTRGEEIHDRQARLQAKDGSIKHVLISSTAYFRDGEFVHTRCFTRDITARQEAEDAVRASERQLQLITDALPVCVSYVDRDLRYRFVSAAYEKWFGRSKQELLGNRVQDVIGASAYDIVGPYIDRALSGESVTYHGDIPYLDNQTRSIEATYIPQFGEDRTVIGFVAIISDVSERNAFERFRAAATARAEQLYRFAQAVVAADKVDVVFDAALAALEVAVGANRAAILIFDTEGVMRFKAWRNLSDNYRRAVEGHSPWPHDAVAPEPVVVPDVDTDASMAAFLPLFKDEGIGSLAFIPLVTRGRLIGKFMIYYRDAHDYSPSELELATAIASHVASVTARFAAVAKLEETIRYNDLFAGVLAHDLRNPLGAIMTAAQVALMRQEGSHDAGTAKPISRIIASGERMTRMIDQLLDVTRARAGGGIHVEPNEVNLADLCAQAIGEVELAFPHWTVKREAIGELDGRWDPDRLLQIVSNLVSNAGQHGRPEGVVTVRLDGRDPDAVVLEIHNGGSIPASIMPSLFDPFRGTRSPRDTSRGLGLGLFIVKAITEAHGGTVQVESSAAQGTTFVVRLPRRAVHSPAPS